MTTRAEFEQRRHEVADYILWHPDQFDMATFGTKTACGTVACLAGTAAFLEAQRGKVWLHWGPGDGDGGRDLHSVRLPNGTRLPVDSWASDYLGLTSANIFYDDNIDDPELAAKAILDEPYRDDPSLEALRYGH